MKILITGAKGQLAREFIRQFTQKGTEFVDFSREELDVSDFKAVYKLCCLQ
jgi:dTDP-4-dehydrorhamnose reductase